MITKLEDPPGSKTVKYREAGQKALDFSRLSTTITPASISAGSTRDTVKSNPPSPPPLPFPRGPPSPRQPVASQWEQLPPDLAAAMQKIPSTPLTLHPSRSQVDPSVLAELPSSVLRELYPEDYVAKPSGAGAPPTSPLTASANEAAALLLTQSPPPPPSPAAAPTAIVVDIRAPLSPHAGPSHPANAAAAAESSKRTREIATALRPKNKVHVTPPRQRPLFAPAPNKLSPAAIGKAKGVVIGPSRRTTPERAPVFVPLPTRWTKRQVEQVLLHLGTPREVFDAVGLEEFLLGERESLEKGWREMHGCGAGTEATWAPLFSPRKDGASPPPPPLANKPAAPLKAFVYPPPPVLGKGKDKAEATEDQTIESLREQIDRWFALEADRKQRGPSETGLRLMGDFLTDCLGARKGGGGGESVRKAFGVLKWWRYRCRQRWPEAEETGVAARRAEEGRGVVGAKWWGAFDRLRERAETVWEEKYGGGLMLD